MRKIIKDFFAGVLIFIIWSVLAFAIYLLFAKLFNDPAIENVRFSGLLKDHSMWLSLFLTLFAAALIPFLFAWLFKTKTKNDSLKRSIMWSLVLVIWYLLIGLMNGTAVDIFTSYYFYFVLVSYFSGPLIYAIYRKLPKSDNSIH